ncbi:hypothetical protein [Ascidiimonas aurantiaca]|uniref:hypothetical protein n=1 Tax=Ascidiimonas aurantiaca TaxID=1685432 RepID=UPI0030EC2D10
MKRVYKIIIFFVVIFLIGILSFIGYINYSLNRTEEVRSADAEKTTKQTSANTRILF